MSSQGYTQKYAPNLKAHFYVSMAKSCIRILGYLLLLGIPSPYAKAAAAVLVISELVGIIEEMV